MTSEEILKFLIPYAEQLNLEIVEVDFKINKNPYLTVVIDKEGGVDLDTCEAFHNLINEPLDSLDPSPVPYTLNVSSPGVDRPFKRDKDFIKHIGVLCEVKLYAPLRGIKSFEGILKEYDGNNIVIELNGKDEKIPLNKVAKINEAIIFD